ncbi:phosphoribosylamine--glycine ligase [Companilactobacillus sp. RD055328]|uniref:phosphoribosylamine--glycine ligase n=1 Tax=Companilactobacillus sp. RD055328 TaxID=2916634 RepID=UPI001FC7DFB7|nr:phosphoribosylamine--glycine ligase [Companilactobacillus sp. RD055328]GKQ42598.1 phosphoribosylamine--glycine ligase [Companilactobacillus sp. RD055328]
MNILVIGSGAREHTICRKLLESPEVGDVYCLPGNFGMKNNGIKLVHINPFEFEEVIDFTKNNSITYTVVGPEDVLVAGIVDEFKKNNLLIFGPSKEAAQLEGSKDFAKQIMNSSNVATASSQTFGDINEALSYLSEVEYPIVIKKDGLASGKGVVIADNLEIANEVCSKFLNETGSTIIIEEYLDGEEISAMYFVQGLNSYPMPFSQDYKRAFDNGEGPNTGGMGAYAPLKQMGVEERKAADKIIEAVLVELNRRRIEFTGIIYAGLIKTNNGIKVIEFNVRFGDPETEVVLPLLESDLAVNILEILQEKKTKFIWNDRLSYVCVVNATKGYPSNPSKVKINAFPKLEKTKIFYSNLDSEERSSGRSFVIVGSGTNIKEAQEEVYKEVPEIPGFFYRKDIGK